MMITTSIYAIVVQKLVLLNYLEYFCAQILCIMQWNKDILKKARISANLSQSALAEALGVHFRTVQNWEKGSTPIPIPVSLALDKLLGEIQDVVPREEYNKVVEALNSATELNRKLTDLLQSNAHSINPKDKYYNEDENI